MSKQRKWMPIVASGLLVVIVALVGVMVLPQTTLAAPAAGRGGQGGPGLGPQGDDTYLADALGITADKLTAARQSAYEAGIQEALSKGLITQAQADMLKSNQGNGKGHGFGSFYGGDQIDQEKLLATALNITVEQLQAAEKKAEEARVAQAVTDGKITQEQADNMKARSALQTFIQQQGFFQKILQEAVKAGIITQAQADTFLKNDSGRGLMPFGGRGDMGGGHGGRGGMAPSPSTTPSATGAKTN